MATTPTMHVINAKPPVADTFDTATDTDIIDAGLGSGVWFIIQEGATAGAGVSTITVEASSTITATAVATVPFWYRTCTATDVWSAWTYVAKTGFAATMTTANSMWQVWVDSSEIAEEGYRYVRLSTDETGDFAVLAGILAIITEPRYAPMAGSVLD